VPTSKFQPSFAGGVVGPSLYGRIDTAKYDVALKVGHNVFVHVHGGVSNRAGTQFVDEVMDHAHKHRLLPFKRSEDENCVLVLGDQKMRIIQNGGYVLDGADPYEIATPYSAAQAAVLHYTQSVDVVFMAMNEVYPQKLSRSHDTAWAFADLAVNPAVPPPTITGVSSAKPGSNTYTYKVSAIVNGVESLPSAAFTKTGSQDLAIAGARNTISFTGVDGAQFNIYKERSGAYGYIGYATTGSFVDDNINQDLTKAPVAQSTRFATAQDYPAVVNLFQQRLIFGNTPNEPETIFLSRIAGYENFTKKAVLTADDSFAKSMTGDGIAAIKYMLQLRELLIFTSLGEFSLSGPDGVLTATNPIETQFGYSGSTDVPALVVEDTALFVDRTGRQVRDLRYAFEQDGYSGHDLTVFVPQYFANSRIAGWAYAKNPYSVVWCYLEDGTLLSLTYKREHQVWAWCDHDLSGGQVEQAVVIPEGDFDRLYLVVKRTIKGQERRYIERMHDRAFTDVADAWFVDCGLKYTGKPATVIAGLDHLEGEEVVALADGNVVCGLTVIKGQITLKTAASTVIIGLPYCAEIENLPPAIDLPDAGSARGRPISITRLSLHVERTRGIKAGHCRSKLNELIQTKKDLSAPIGMQTDMISIHLFAHWNKRGTVIIRQDYPLPMTILGLSPEISVGRSA
jgi:hypothetical protein